MSTDHKSAWRQAVPLIMVIMARLGSSASLRDSVLGAYSAIANRPGDDHPVPVGRALAEGVGYPAALLAQVPSQAVAAFAGVSNLHAFAEIPEGSLVLDLGCGSGVDSIIAARRASTVVAVDFSEAMLARARVSAEQAGASNIAFRKADAESIPVDGSTVDVVLVNGLFNLNPARAPIFDELARVTRRGGHVYAAELILREPLPAHVEESIDDWFA